MSIAPRFKVYLLVLCLLALCMAFVLPANAAELTGLNFTMEVDPSTMTSPGKTTVKVRLANSGQTDITLPMSLYDADDKIVPSFFDGGTLSQLKVGETQVWSGEYAVTQAQLDAGKLIFTLKAASAQSAGSTISFPAEASLTYIGEKVDLSIKRVVEPEVVRKDDTVTVLYELVNNGNVRLTDIRVREHSSLSNKTETIASLEPGANATVKFEKKASTNDLTSHPNITYKKDGSKETLRMSLDNLVIPSARPNLKLALTADETSVNIGDKVVLTLVLQNDGNVTYSDVTVTDAKLGEVFANIDIPAKQTITRTKEVTMQETTTFLFEVSMKDNTGREQKEKTTELKVSAYDPTKMVRLTLEMTADRESIDTVPGVVEFTVNITNNSDFEVKDIKLNQGATRVYTIGALAPGATTKMTRMYEVSQAGKFQFTAEAVDSQKNTQTFTSNALDIPFVPATPAPTKEVYVTIPPVVTYTPVPAETTGISGSQGVNTLLILTIAVGALFGISFLLFGASTLMRARARRQSDAAYDHLNREVKRDYLDPDTYTQGKVKEAEEVKDTLEERLVEEELELPHTKYLKEDLPKADAAIDEIAEVEEIAVEVETPVETPAEEGGYRLTRENELKEEPAAQQTEHRSRRSDKHK